jgi:hypothetical protein
MSGAGQQSQLLKLVGGQQMSLVKDHHDALAALVLLRRQRVGGLGDQRRLVEPGHTTEGGDDGGVEAPGADGGVAEVDDGVAGGVEGGGGGPGGDRFPRANFTSDHAQGAFADAPGDAGDRFAVPGRAVQHARGQVPPEGRAGEAVVGLDDVDAHWASLSRSGMTGWPGHWPGSVISARPE